MDYKENTITASNILGVVQSIVVKKREEELFAVEYLANKGFITFNNQTFFARWHGKNLDGVQFFQCTFKDGGWHGVTASGAQFNKCLFERWGFMGCGLNGSIFLDNSYKLTGWLGSSLRGGILQKGKLDDSRIVGCDVDGLTFGEFALLSNTVVKNNAGTVITDEFSMGVFADDARGEDQNFSQKSAC